MHYLRGHFQKNAGSPRNKPKVMYKRFGDIPKVKLMLFTYLVLIHSHICPNLQIKGGKTSIQFRKLGSEIDMLVVVSSA
jgi:hypothetical protein